MPRKTTPKAAATPKAPRRSHSLFTSVGDAMLLAKARPYRVGLVTVKGESAYAILDNATGKRAKGTPLSASRSSARRAMYKAERASGFKVTARALTSARNAKAKAQAKPKAKAASK